MQEDFIFSDAGGTESVYNDSGMTINIEGREVYVPSNVAIKDSTYKIGLANDYKTLLEFLADNNLFMLYRLNYLGAQLPAVEV